MMNEFSFDRASDWDLQAIVKGRPVTASNTMNNMSPWFGSLGLEGHQGGHEHAAFIFNKHEPLNHGISTNSQKLVDSSMMNFDLYAKSLTDEPKEKVTDASCANIRATISKRRKNKHKIIEVVQQAGGDRVFSDKWNWRKYGEKVIKGSPYPRSYYRCSYTGGCLARKQVEQSTSDPGLFLITYMEEHSHPYPTRRHSQAGRCAQRFNHSSSSKIVMTNESQHTAVGTVISESLIQNDQVLDLRGDEDDGNAEYVRGKGVQDRVCEEDFLAGLDYLEGLNYLAYYD